MTLLVAGAGSYNIGSENEKTKLGLVHILCEALDRLQPRADGKPYADQITFVTDRPGHDARYKIETDRIHNELGWRPCYLDNENWWHPLQDRSGVRLGTAPA